MESVVQSSNKYKITPKLLFEIKLHGFLLWASVGFLMPVAILIKRMSIREESGRRLRIIFYIHAITQVLAVLLATAGAVMSIKYFDNSFSNDHQRIGLAFYIIMWLQALIGIFRPHRGSKGRSIWFVFHWLVGISVSLLGVINIYTGLQAYHDRTSKNVRVWTIIFTLQISLILFFYILQEKWNYIQKQGAVLGNKPVQPTDQEMSPRCPEKAAPSQPC
ncbi:cytochrome b561 domain-containing protein At2g30890-like [Sesamum indicum]|uniref:Cytochrome b561 domain-containing protein At2g30890-like n=1 Tax=Sesamum indicum TaxID=4182 RepID=A0A6I9UK22_SESIN|nr:cytochrome b561 domain-containing protein At2g30890-like [Sesamum indicum]